MDMDFSLDDGDIFGIPPNNPLIDLEGLPIVDAPSFVQDASKNRLSEEEQRAILNSTCLKWAPHPNKPLLHIAVTSVPFAAGASADLHMTSAEQRCPAVQQFFADQQFLAAKCFKFNPLRTLAKIHLSISNEIEIMCSLNHKYVIKALGVSWDSHKPTIFFPYYSCSMWDLIQRKPLGPDELVGIAHSLLLALDHVHSQGVVHGDIKPHNILWNSCEDFVLADFGSSVFFNSSTTATTMFTEQFANQALASGGSVDVDSDLFALGCTLICCLTGQLPWPSHAQFSVFPLLAKGCTPSIPKTGNVHLERLIDALLHTSGSFINSSGETKAWQILSTFAPNHGLVRQQHQGQSVLSTNIAIEWK